MKLIVLAPLIALALVGGSAGAYFWLSSEGSVEDATVDQPTAEPTVETPTSTPAPQSALPQPQPTLEPADWTAYEDAELGFSFPHPPRLTASEQFFDLPEKKGNPPVQLRTVSFRNAEGVPVVGFAVAPNPAGLTLEEWIRTYPGWPSEPQAVTIGGQSALLFPINQLGDQYPGIYFGHSGFVFSISGNVFGIPGEGGVSGFPPGITEADFQRIIDGFTFAP